MLSFKELDTDPEDSKLLKIWKISLQNRLKEFFKAWWQSPRHVTEFL